MEKIYKTMRNSGVCCIVAGIVILTAGISAGVISVINGAILLKKKSQITF